MGAGLHGERRAPQGRMDRQNRDRRRQESPEIHRGRGRRPRWRIGAQASPPLMAHPSARSTALTPIAGSPAEVRFSHLRTPACPGMDARATHAAGAWSDICVTGNTNVGIVGSSAQMAGHPFPRNSSALSQRTDLALAAPQQPLLTQRRRSGSVINIRSTWKASLEFLAKGFKALARFCRKCLDQVSR